METALTISAKSAALSGSHRERLISEWLFKFSAALPQGKEPIITPETAPMVGKIWEQGLADIPLEALEACFQETLRASRFFPTVADIRAHFDAGQDARAEDEWQRVLEYCSRFVYRDLGVLGPRLPADIDHAVRAAGGLFRLKECSEDDLQWAKKRFLEDLARQRKSEQVAPLLGPSPLAQMLDKLATRRQLPCRAARELPSACESVSVLSVEEARQRIMARATPAGKASDESAMRSLREWADKRHARENEPIFAQWREAHGILKSPSSTGPQVPAFPRTPSAEAGPPKTSDSGKQP